MTKKSRSRAARYSELSKQGKRRQQRKSYPQPTTTTTTTTTTTPQEIAKPVASVSPVPKTMPKSRTEVVALGHVANDLKRIGIIAGAIIVVLIILSFVLS